ncbi:MAG: barstar family protein, partial [Proteobacteria bacterium]|nr:barstar family protein [Pseudomonadota bacterium]
MSETDSARLEALLRDVTRAGVYHLPHALAGGQEALVGAAEACGYFVFSVDLSAAKDKEGLLQAIGRDMSFPEWYGRNWDALADC